LFATFDDNENERIIAMNYMIQFGVLVFDEILFPKEPMWGLSY
jgi:hypothetical protein